MIGGTKIIRTISAFLLVIVVGICIFILSGRYRPIQDLELPFWGSGSGSIAGLSSLEKLDPVIYYKGFSLAFNNKTHQARWVAYELTADEARARRAERQNRFRKDTIPGLLTASNSDYLRSGYDKGHLAPAADMAWDQEAMDQSFFFSNISPQTPRLNRGAWKFLEDQIRKWAIQFEGLYLITGPLLTIPIDTIGEIPVPPYFFKAILVYQADHQQSIGFLFPNEKDTDGDYRKFALSVDSLETLTGLDFFNKLPDRIENRLERSFSWEQWLTDK